MVVREGTTMKIWARMRKWGSLKDKGALAETVGINITTLGWSVNTPGSGERVSDTSERGEKIAQF